jgi:Domain of unknown function (DUF1848)
LRALPVSGDARFTILNDNAIEDVETHIPSKQSHVIPAFKKLSDLIGPNRVIWRYDPILLNDTYTPEYHIRYFEKIAKELSPYTKKCND